MLYLSCVDVHLWNTLQQVSGGNVNSRVSKDQHLNLQQYFATTDIYCECTFSLGVADFIWKNSVM